jgi:sugar-specific transcriptional regulator TrmB
MKENNLLIKQLINFGLSEREASVYLALLKLEVAGVTEIARTSGVKRSSTYVVLESLIKKGFANISEDKKIQRYIAISPELLLEEAKNRTHRAEEIKNKINDILPELKALHKDTKQKPKVMVFEGKQALINALEDSLINKDRVIRKCSSTKNLFKIIPEHMSNYIQKRLDLGIRLYGIHPDDQTEKKIDEMFPNLPQLDRSVYLPQKKYQFSVDIAMYNDKIAYFSPDPKGFAIIIEDREMANVMKNIFDLAYKQVKGFGEKSNKTKT